jgi:hypothetical protein
MSNETAKLRANQDILKLYSISFNGLQRERTETNVTTDWSYVNVHKRVPATESESESIEIVSLYSACERDEPEQKRKTFGLAKPLKKEWHSFSHLMELQGSNLGRIQELKQSENHIMMERTTSFGSFVYSDFDHKSEISVSSPALLPLPMFGEELSKAFRNRTSDEPLEPLVLNKSVVSLPDLDLNEDNFDSVDSKIAISKSFISLSEHSDQVFNAQESNPQDLDEYLLIQEPSVEISSENHELAYNEFDKLDQSTKEFYDQPVVPKTEDKSTNTKRSIFEPIQLYLNLSDKTMLKISEFESVIFPSGDGSPDEW